MYGSKQNLISIEALAEGTLLVSLRGEWDLCVADDLKRAFDTLGLGKDIVLDLRRVEFIDSTALTQIVHLHRRLTIAGRRLETISTGVVRRLFDICALNRLVGITPDRQAWVDDCRRRAAMESAF